MRGFIAEFKKQSFTQIIFPHVDSDWVKYLDEAKECFISIINTVAKYQKCLVICDDIDSVKGYFKDDENLYFIEYKTDDTWARDCSAISIVEDEKLKLLNFTFNGWGSKFEASKDNLMTKKISKHYDTPIVSIDFVLEGGAIESNADGIVLTTSTCMKNINRNPTLNNIQITKKLKDFFNAKEILYLNHGYLKGDDTDSHVDTLARFIDNKTIVYVTCKDIDDEHFKELKLMEKELETMAKIYNFTLVGLPMPEAIYFKKERLPATYANFLFVNGAILVPVYGVKEDDMVLEIFKSTCKDREVIAINCSTLIKQHGSLHCVCMNFPTGVEILI